VGPVARGVTTVPSKRLFVPSREELARAQPTKRRRIAPPGYLQSPMEETLTRAREILDRRTAIAMLSTASPDGTPDVCLLIAARLTDSENLAGGEEEAVSGQAFRNLRRSPRATILVLDPIMDPRARDGVRLEVEFLGAEEDGEELGHLSQWLESFAPGRRVIRRLLFKLIDVTPYRPYGERPVLLQ